MAHALTRISPYGTAFIGRCVKCGEDGFGTEGALEPCPADGLVSDDQVLIKMIDDGPDEEEH